MKPATLRILMSIAAASSCLAPTTGRATSAEWKIGQGKTCTLYQTQEKRFVFIAAQSAAEWFLRVHTANWKIPDGAEVSFRISTGETADFVSGRFASTSNGWDGLMAQLQPELIEAAAANGFLEVDADDEPFDRLSLDGLDEAMTRLRDCIADRGYEAPLPPTLRPVTRPVLTSQLSITPGELEAFDLSGGEITFRLDVDEAGLVSKCTILKSSAPAAVNNRACAMLQAQARFNPARNSSGKPVSSDYQSRLVF